MLLEHEEMMPILLLNWLVVYLPPWKLWKSDWIIIQKKWGKSHSCSKPPTSIDIWFYKYYYRILSQRYIYIYIIYILYIYYIYIVDEPNIGSQDPNRIPGKDAQWRWIPVESCWPLALAFPQDLMKMLTAQTLQLSVPREKHVSRIGLVLLTSYKYLVVVSST